MTFGSTDNMAKKILYISYDGLTDALGQSQILAYQKHISSPDVQVTIMSFEKKDSYSKLGSSIAQICKEANIHWRPLFYTKRPPILSTAYDLYHGWQEIKRLQRTTSFDIVHCRGYISALLGEKMKKNFHTKFIFDMRGWWPDEKLESGNWAGTLYLPIYKYFKKKELDFFRQADITVSLTESGKSEIVTNGWQKENKVQVVPTCTDLSLFQLQGKDKRLALKASLGFPADAKILVYSGSLGGNYPVEDLFLLLRQYLALSPLHYCLILAKYGDTKVALPERTILKSVPYSEVGPHLAACDFGFIYYTKAYSNIGRCPTKLGEYWACGLPAIIPSEIGDVDSLFNTYPTTGVSVPHWYIDEIDKSLQQLLATPFSKAYLRQSAINHFSLDKGVDFYKNLYYNLL